MRKNDHEIIRLLSDETFQQWLSGKADEKKNRYWEDWKNSTPENKQLYETALQLWKFGKFKSNELPDLESEWQELERKLNFSTLTKSQTTSTPLTTFHFKRPRYQNNRWLRISAMAAVMFILVLTIWFTLFKPTVPQYRTFTTTNGQQTRLNLPEDITIILNANSSLEYPTPWRQGDQGKFTLSGEAYFDLTSTSTKHRREFNVYTADGLVKVTGTRFAIYERGEGTRVVIEQGQVEVSARKTDAEEYAGKTKLFPGDLLYFHRGMKNLNPKSANILSYITWWKDYYVLDKTPFKEIVQRLEETYNIEVRVKDKQLLTRTLSGSVENRNLNILIKALAKAMRVSVQKDENVITFG